MSRPILIMIMQGSAPEGLTELMLNPIPKDKGKSISDSNNYGWIVLIIGKLLDWVIMTDNEEFTCIYITQFGFKSNNSMYIRFNGMCKLLHVS